MQWYGRDCSSALGSIGRWLGKIVAVDLKELCCLLIAPVFLIYEYTLLVV
jgi:hypothetical protein